MTQQPTTNESSRRRSGTSTGRSTADLSPLVRFLIARLDEDTTELRRLRRQRADSPAPADTAHGPRSTARLQVECESKRDIVALAQHLLVLRDLPNEREVRDSAAQVLKAMAEPYSEHPAYQQVWARRPAAVLHQLRAGRQL